MVRSVRPLISMLKRQKAEIAAFEAGDIAKARQLQHESNDPITDLLNNGILCNIEIGL